MPPLGCIRRFQLRARLEFSLSAFTGQRGVTPAFGYDTPHPGARGTLTLLNDALLSAHFDPLRHPDGPWPFLTTFARPPPPSRASPTDRRLPSWHAVLTTPVALSVPMVIGLARSRARFFRIGSAFPAEAPGRHPIASFEACSSFTRVTACQVARPPFRGLCRQVPIRPVSQPDRSPAIQSNHQLFEWVLPPLVIRPFRAHASERCMAPRSGTEVPRGLKPAPPACFLTESNRAGPDESCSTRG